MDVFNNQLKSGLKWSFFGQGSGQLLSLLISVVMARMILPETFGKFTMVNVIIGFSSIFIDLGFGAAIVQKKKVDDALLSSVFWVNVIIGACLFVLMYGLAETIALFYKNDELIFISKVLSILFIINAIGTVPGNLLSKSMKFKKLAFASIFSIAISGSIGISLAYFGYEIEAVIAHVLLQRTIGVVIIFIQSHWAPNLYLSRRKLNEISSFSLNVLANDTLNYWVRNIDSMLIGRFLGSSDLGIYNKSYTFLTLPLRTISGSISRVLFPSFSSIQNQRERVKETYLKIIETIAIVVFPSMVGLFVVAEEFVIVVLGSNWLDAVPIVRVFCLLAINQSISTLISNLYLSQGRADLMLKVTTPLRVMLILAIIVGINWGILGVAICYTIASYLSSIINHSFAGKLVGLRLKDYTSSLVTPLVLAIAMGISVYISDSIFMEEWSYLNAFIMKVIVGLIVFLLMVELYKPRHYDRLRQRVFSRIKGEKQRIEPKDELMDFKNQEDYWENRAKKYGKKAVYNLSHDNSNLDDITENQIKAIFPYIGRFKGSVKNIFDFGCGPGRFSGPLADFFEAKVLAVDPINHFLEIAPKHPLVEYKLLEKSKIDDKFDLIWICLVLGGLEDDRLEELVEYLNKITEPGSILCLVENTAKKTSSEHWRFRSVDFYKTLFNAYTLNLENSYIDVGEEISIMVGRKK